MRAYVMEFVGVFFLILSIALTGNPLAIGLALAAMIYIGGHVSGAHYNPAVTLAVWMRGKLPAKKIGGYMLAQVLGAFAAAAVAYYLGKTFIPAPGTGATVWQVVLLEILFTFILALVVLTMATTKKLQGNYLYGLVIGLTVTAGAFAAGSISGGVFNPAVALGPMLFGAIIGSVNFAHTLVYVLGAFFGGALAAAAYLYLNPEEN